MARTITVGPDDKVVVRVPLSPAERGRLGARKRWGDHERPVIRRSDMTPDQWRAITNYLRISKAATEGQSPVAADAEVRGGSLDSAA